MPNKTKESLKKFLSSFSREARDARKKDKKLLKEYNQEYEVTKFELNGGNLVIGFKKKTVCRNAGDVVKYWENRFEKIEKKTNTRFSDIIKERKSELQKRQKWLEDYYTDKNKGDHYNKTKSDNDQIGQHIETMEQLAERISKEVAAKKKKWLDPVVKAYGKKSEMNKMNNEFNELVGSNLTNVCDYKYKSYLGVAIKNMLKVHWWNKKIIKPLVNQFDSIDGKINGIYLGL